MCTVCTLHPMERIGVRELREQLGRRVDAAHFKDEQTVIEKNGEPRAVLVPYEWWIANVGQPPEAD
ncbi:type II toxin-antitoxin system Phd/YefM family antitoxin [Streptomyces sp. DT224]|uniref:type II toxin-antitoxin system Phd/YefM family antitoxin n=1 Tax=Streptomyces sp. DT224 TaxID=3393426 RepID=UPI003CEB9A88